MTVIRITSSGVQFRYPMSAYRSIRPVRVGALIEDEDAHADSEELRELSLALAKSCRKSIGDTWNVPLAQFNVRSLETLPCGAGLGY
jgi:hypothetical protein